MTNEKVYALAREELNTKDGTDRQTNKSISKISDIIIERMIKELGEVIRLPPGDPRRDVTFLDDEGLELNLPPVNRVGRPKNHWTISTMQRIWHQLELNKRTSETQQQEFYHTNETHLGLIYAVGTLKEF